MYGFLRTPKWVLGHVLVLTVVLGFPSLGLWQLRRLDEVQAYNATVAGRLDAAPVPLDTALGDGDAEYRRVELAGRWRPEDELLLVGRSRDGRPGHHVLTPLVLEDGRGTVLVDRGWVPYELDTPPIVEAAPADGTAAVIGFVRATQPSGRLGGRVPEGGGVRVTAVDLDRLRAQVEALRTDAWVQAEEVTPTAAPLPIAEPPPILDEGNHLSYAMQWFIFAGIAGIGYVLLVVRTARESGAELKQPRRAFEVPAPQ